MKVPIAMAITNPIHLIVNGPEPASIVVDEGEPVGSL